jgi:hypothetical protein
MQMKKIRLILAVFIGLSILFSAFSKKAGSIKGSVLPQDAAVRAVAVSTTDTVASLIQDGNFSITGLKPGVYNLLIEAKPPYKDEGVKDITVKDGESVDVGIIRLIN